MEGGDEVRICEDGLCLIIHVLVVDDWGVVLQMQLHGQSQIRERVMKRGYGFNS